MKKLQVIAAVVLTVGILLMAAGCSKTKTTTTPTTTLPPGTPTVQAGDTITVDYTLKLANGTVYQTTVGTGQPFSFEVGAGQVIAGFDAGVRGMYIGQTKTVNIPAAQAYGTQKSASNPLAGQNLTFIITLDEIQPSLSARRVHGPGGLHFETGRRQCLSDHRGHRPAFQFYTRYGTGHCRVRCGG